jgi:hypothetical protein
VYPNLGEGVRQQSAGSYLFNESEWRLLELIPGAFCKDLCWRNRAITVIEYWRLGSMSEMAMLCQLLARTSNFAPQRLFQTEQL